MLITLDHLRRFTVARNFLNPTRLERALQRIGFVQADPIRAPARAQDLILRHRVRDYHAGDLERRYGTLEIEEDVFVNYGFVTSSLHALMHPREEEGSRSEAERKGERAKTEILLEFVRERGEVHPREVDEHFSHGTVENYWGGSSNATTHLLELMHYRGMLRVARREKGVRIYSTRDELPFPAGGDACALGLAPVEAAEHRAPMGARIDALVDAVVRIYAPLPGPSLSSYVRRLRYAVPQWREELTGALQRSRQLLAHTRIDGIDWYWPARENAARHISEEKVRLLAPFDPLVHDRLRFELLWGWAYRFEAYTPVRKRKLGYYALPLLWRERVIGWANLTVKSGELKADLGYVKSQPRDRAFRRELKAELERIQDFLGLEIQSWNSQL